MFINHKHKFIFIHIPKNAGTSIRNSFNINGYDKHIVSKRYPHSTCSEIKDYLKNGHNKHRVSEEIWNSYYKFSFVRHPFDRLVSFYHFHKSSQYKHKVGRERAYAQTFKEWVMNTKDKNVIQTQSDYLDEQINFIGCYENLQEDFNSVCNQIGIPPYELPHYNQSQHEHWSTFWDDELNEYILDKYQQDFQNFAYSINVVRNGIKNN